MGDPGVLATQERQQHDVVLRAEKLTWRVGGFTIVSDVTLAIRRGEFLSVIGPNGAGKSTLINLLSGTLAPSSGSITLDDHTVTKLGPAARVRQGMGRTFQTSSLFPKLTVLENVRLSAQASLGSSLNLLRPPLARDGAFERARSCLTEVGLDERRFEVAANLPYGDKRKLEIAVVLCQNPSVVLLDEPTAGVSTEDLAPFIDVVRNLHRGGRTVVMVEHHMDLVLDASDRIAVMQDGRLIACDAPNVIINLRSVQDAYLGPGL